MPEPNLKQKTISGVMWSFAENISLLAFSFVQGVILARLLMPSDYGHTTALMSLIYMALSIFFFFFFCLLLCACSSVIADFYNEPLLKKIVCVNAILMFCGSFIAVQSTRLTKQLDFNIKSIINV